MTHSNDREEAARKIRGAENPNQHFSDSDSTGEPGSTSSTFEDQPLGVNRANSEKFEIGSGSANLGGILRQLRNLQEAHLAYVNAHTERLRLWLEEDDRHRQQIMKDMAQLEQEIIQSFSKQAGLVESTGAEEEGDVGEASSEVTTE